MEPSADAPIIGLPAEYSTASCSQLQCARSYLSCVSPEVMMARGISTGFRCRTS